MRPMSMREMHALCFERGVEFDPATLPVEELADRARLIVARPVWDGRSVAQEMQDRRAAERRERRRSRMVLRRGPDHRAVGTGASGGGVMWHALLTAATVAALGCGAWNLVALVRIVVDVVFAGEGREPALWPDPDSVTVWTGMDWFTVTVMWVAFGRWGIAVCRDSVPRRADPFELIARERAEAPARERARLALADGACDQVIEPAAAGR